MDQPKILDVSKIPIQSEYDLEKKDD